MLFNAVLHSGIYTWLGLYFVRRHHVTEVEIGLALLGYGVPGFLLGPAIGPLTNRRGRARLIPLGLAVGATSVFVLAPTVPVLVAAAAVTLLSLGYDLTQPLLGGIALHSPRTAGRQMELNVFTLFVGFGLGSLVFQALLNPLGFAGALVVPGAAATVAAVLAVHLFSETVAPDVHDPLGRTQRRSRDSAPRLNSKRRRP